MAGKPVAGDINTADRGPAQFAGREEKRNSVYLLITIGTVFFL